MKKIFILLLSLAGGLQYSKGQTGTLQFDHFTQQTGLPDQQIQFVLQDEQGYMWFGTLLGLVRYDGYTMKSYAFNDSTDRRKDVWTTSSVTDAGHNMWFATLNLFGTAATGLVKYDRRTDRLISFPYPDKLNKLSFQEVKLSFADDKGNLWGKYTINHHDSTLYVFRFDSRNKKFFYYGEQFSATHENIASLVPVRIFKSGGKDGAVWLSDSKGLSRFDYRDSTFHAFLNRKDNGFGQIIRWIYEAPSERGILWLNTVDPVSRKLSMARLDTKKKKLNYYQSSATPGLTRANDSVNYMYEDSRRRLWLATENGLVLFDRQSKAFTGFVPVDTARDPQKNEITSIVESKDGSLWLLNGRSLLRFDCDKHAFQRYSIKTIDPNAVRFDELKGLMFDHSGLLWSYGGANGIHKLNIEKSASRIFPITVYDGSADQTGFTNNIITDDSGFCWFTNQQGVFKWKAGGDKPQQVYKTMDPIGGLDGLYRGKDGKIYFGGGHGLSILDPASGKLENFTFNKNDTSSISGNLINSILQDHTGLVWIGTVTGGVCTFNPATKKFKRYPFDRAAKPAEGKGKLDNFVVDIIREDKEGTIWVGTHLGGLNRFDRKTGKFTSYYKDGQRNVYTVTHLLDDRAGHFWIGAYSLGLYEFDRGSGHYTKHFNEDNGLLFNTVTGIEQDDKGYVWIGSVRGLTRIDPETMEIKTFPLSSILPGRSLISDHNLVKTSDGRLVLVLTDGLAVLNPRDLDPNPYAPDVHIEQVSYSNPAAAVDSLAAKVAYGISRLQLPHNQNRVTFSYVGLHYADPVQNRYAYWLEGFDRHLVQAGRQRNVTYTNLAPGTYTFHVTAANSDGVWNKKGDSFTIVILPPWWSTWWAWILWVASFAAGVYAFVTYRSRKLRRDNRLLEHKVHIRTEEVLQQKEEIEAQRDSLEQAYSELESTQAQLLQREKMASLGELTAGIAHEIQNPLNFVNNFSEVSAELVDELQAELDNGDVPEVKAISIDLKQNLEKIRHHGKRAEGIVKGMLEHSRVSPGQKEPTDLNQLADEYLRLAYHGYQARDKNAKAVPIAIGMITHFDESLPKINVIPQDIGRVLLNLFNNAFYAVAQKAKTADPGYKPTIEVTTLLEGDQIAISVKDNGMGIPDAIKEKIMQPFFTTKPTGEGTGLGLSLSYDIVVKGHGGNIEVETNEGEYSTFKIILSLT